MAQKTVKQKKNSSLHGKCADCAYCSEPHSLSIYGVPTLGKCYYEKWSVLYQRECQNGRFKPK